MQIWLLPGVERAGRFYWGCTGSTGTLWATVSSELGLDSYLLWCTQAEMGNFDTQTNIKISYRRPNGRIMRNVASESLCTVIPQWCPTNTLSVPNLGIYWDRAAHWDCGCHHGVLVSHQPHCHTTDGTLPVLAVPCHLPQLPHMEGQPWEKRRVGDSSVCFETTEILIRFNFDVQVKSLRIEFKMSGCHRLINISKYVD